MSQPTIADDADLPTELYHYTTAGGLHGILEKHTLWATHVAYLNDSQELLYGIQVILDELRRRKFNPPFYSAVRYEGGLANVLGAAVFEPATNWLGQQVEKPDTVSPPKLRPVRHLPVEKARSTEPVAWVRSWRRLRYSL